MNRYKSRAELDAMLADLETDLPEMIEECQDDDELDYGVFAGAAEEIENSASPTDRAYIHAKIQCMLGAAGLIPSENEGQPCITPAAGAP